MLRLLLDELLRSRRDEILRRWETLVVSEPRAVVLSDLILRNDLPTLLDALADWLGTEPIGEGAMHAVSTLHIVSRLDHSFQLAQLIQEYRLLRRTVLIVVLEAEAAEQARVRSVGSPIEGQPQRVVALARLNEGLDLILADAVLQFVDERDRRLAVAQSAAEHYRALAQLSPDAILVLRGGNIEFANLSAVKLWGLASEADLVGQSPSALFDPVGFEEFRRQTDRLLRGEAIVPSAELVPVRRDGSQRVVDAVASLIEQPPGVFVEVTARDITERKRGDQVLREANQRKADFLAVLSHELRNPLMPIQSAVEIMRQVAPGSLQSGRALDVIDRQLMHLTGLVSDLLDLSRIDHGKVTLARTRFDAREIIRQACDDMQPTFNDRGITLRLALEASPLWVEADAGRIAQITTNLLSNAAKFTPAAGRVDVSLSRRDGACELVVRDTGSGIAPALLSAIFEPFAQADRTRGMARGGLGIGLAIVKNLVELHGGTVRASSEGPGRGSAFVVAMPLAEPGPSRHAAPSAARGPALAILIIEDNRDAADTLAAMLELKGHETRVAYDGRSGVTAYAERTPDVLLCDIGLSAETGYDVIRSIRELPTGSDAFAIAVTGYAQHEDIERAKEAGFDAHLPKPVPLDRLAELLEAASANNAAHGRT